MLTLRSEDFQYFKQLIVAAYNVDVLGSSVLCWRSKRITWLPVKHNPFVHVSAEISLVRICASNKFNKNTADTPHIYLGVVVLLNKDNLWWSIESRHRVVWECSSCLRSQRSFALKSVRKMELTVGVVFGLHRTQWRSGTHLFHTLWFEGHGRIIIHLHGVIKLIKFSGGRLFVAHNSLITVV